MSDLNTIHPLWLVVASLIFATFPIFIGVSTSYLKVSIVLGMLKSGFGTQQAPGAMVVMALSLALSSFIMAPVLSESVDVARSIDLRVIGKAPAEKTLSDFEKIFTPWKKFMRAHSGEREIKTLLETEAVQSSKSNENVPASPEAVATAGESFRYILPAFVLTELKQAFSMALVLLLPFLVVDLIVAHVLAALGMFMVSPAMISLPLKILLFVSADGWLLLSRGLILSYGGGPV